MMKRTKLIPIMLLTLLLCPLSGYAQSADKLAEKLESMEYVNSVYISNAMLSLFPNMKTESVDIGAIASKLKYIKVFSCDTPKVFPQIKEELAHITPKDGYTELMRAKEGDEQTVIYLKQRKEDENEFILIASQPYELSVIIILGKLELNDIQGLVK
jgi:hypothetical protein